MVSTLRATFLQVGLWHRARILTTAYPGAALEMLCVYARRFFSKSKPISSFQDKESHTRQVVTKLALHNQLQFHPFATHTVLQGAMLPNFFET